MDTAGHERDRIDTERPQTNGDGFVVVHEPKLLMLMYAKISSGGGFWSCEVFLKFSKCTADTDRKLSATDRSMRCSQTPILSHNAP